MSVQSEEELNHPGACGILPVVGTKWGFAIISELSQGPSYFKKLQRAIGLISTQSLTNTLRLMEQSGLINRQVFPTIPVTVEYSLTDRGRDFQPILLEMNNWFLKWEYNNDSPKEYEPTNKG